jgi:hypothetical protein
MEEERKAILNRVAAGELSVAEAAELLAAMGPVETRGVETGVEDALDGRPAPETHWRRYWIYPLVAGGGVLLLGTLAMTLVNITGAAHGWLVCGWLPMIGGFGIMVLALWSWQARWLHVRIREGGRRTIAFSFPLPLTLAVWVLRIAQPFVPQLADTGVDDLLIALRDGDLGDEPIAIDVQDDGRGEQVQVYFG